MSNPAGIVQTIIDSYKAVKLAYSRISKADVVDSKGRFFERPADSVAREAKKSILYFPLVASDALKPATCATLARMTQLRAAEYVRLMITNLDPVDLDPASPDKSKQGLMGRLRGSSLGDPMVEEQVGRYLQTRGGELVAEELLAGDLAPPLEESSVVMLEAKRAPHRNSGGSGGQGRPQADPRANPRADPRTGPQEPINAPDADPDEMINQADASAIAAEEARQRRDAFKKKMQADPQPGPDGRDVVIHLSPENARNLDELAKSLAKDDMSAAARHYEAYLSGNGPISAALLRDPKMVRLIASLDGVPKANLKAVVGAEEKKTPPDRNAAKIDNWDQVTKVEKFNRHPPLLLDLTVQITRPGADVATTRIMLGIKSIIHAVPGFDLVTGLGKALQRNSFLLQFLRLTSGEISFVGDFLLNLKVARVRAGKASSGVKMLETLRRQTEWNQTRSNFVVSQVASRGFVPPTTTLVVSADEVDRIKSAYGVNFMSPSVVREMLKTYNLMGFMVVDETIGLVSVFEDGDDQYDRVPLSEIEAHTSGAASIRDVVSVLARN